MISEPEQLTKEYTVQEAAQINTRPKPAVEGFQEQEDLRIAYRKYIQTRQRIATIEVYSKFLGTSDWYSWSIIGAKEAPGIYRCTGN